ncbi:MAG: alpha-2-macroglobulin, partial [Bacteroidetes bacterium]|nr:alpha-2-macroglobulin [Bacteroidota bacterium]
TESDRGGMGVLDVFVKDNRFFTRQRIVEVPWTNKQLQIHYASYRDKTQPGSQEKWAVTISGQKQDKVAAEVLTAMYDASLDQFAEHGWQTPYLYGVYTAGRWEGSNFIGGNGQTKPEMQKNEGYSYFKNYDQLITLGNARAFGMGRVRMTIRGSATQPQAYDGAMSVLSRVPGLQVGEAAPYASNASSSDSIAYNKKTYSWAEAAKSDKPDQAAEPGIQVRKNFNETAFFFPDLHADVEGNVSFSFTMPEALTRWKWMTLAQTKDLSFGYSEKTVVTQKELMVQPNVPRFLREGDHMDLAVKVVNLTDSELTGQLALQLTDPTTGQTADGWFTNRQPNQYFTVGAGGSVVVSFPLVIPFQYNRPVTYRVVAEAKSFSDGEEATLPVVS